jgi:hypothetical protein
MEEVYGKLEDAALYIQRNPKIVKSSHCDMELVLDVPE